MTQSPFNVSESFSLRNVRERLDDAERWLGCLGVRTRGRIENYKCTLDTAQNDTGNPTVSQLNAFFEALELVEITALPASLFDSNRKIAQLRQIVKGTETYIDAIGDGPRNFAFQFATAAWLHAAGIAVKIEEPADVVATLKSATLHIECKRPQKAETVVSNAEDAMHWFDNHANAGVRGVVAIDLTKAANPTFVEALGETVSQARAHVSHARDNLVALYYPQIATLKHRGIGARVEAAFFRVRVLTRSLNPPRIEVSTAWGICSLVSGLPFWAGDVGATV